MKNYEFKRTNSLSAVVLSAVAAVFFLAFGFVLFFGDINVSTFDFIKSPIVNKSIALAVMLIISLFFARLTYVYIKDTKAYYKEKADFERENADDEPNDEVPQKTCPNCGKEQDIDYPKCPYCKYKHF